MKHHIVYDANGRIIGLAEMPSPRSKLQGGPMPLRGQRATVIDIPKSYMRKPAIVAMSELRVKGTVKKPKLVAVVRAGSRRAKKKSPPKK